MNSTPRADFAGDFRSCNRLVVEGTLEATLHDCRDIEIAGNAAIEQAEIRGQFEGGLVVRNRLVIRSSGHVSGTITYGEIEIERGGKVSGVIQEAGPVPYFGNVRAVERLSFGSERGKPGRKRFRPGPSARVWKSRATCSQEDYSRAELPMI